MRLSTFLPALLTVATATPMPGTSEGVDAVAVQKRVGSKY